MPENDPGQLYQPPAPPLAAPLVPPTQVLRPAIPGFSAPPRKPGLSRKTIGWIITGSLLLVAIIFGSIAALFFFIAGAVRDREMGPPLVAGEVAEPVAADPLDCVAP